MVTVARKKTTSDEPPPSPWPGRLTQLRADLGDISQGRAADLVGVTRRTWVNWEMGHTVPTAPAAKLLEILIADARKK